MSIKIKNDFDGSNPTAEMPKISFSCGLHTSPQAAYRLRRLFFTKVAGALIPLRFLYREKARSRQLLACKRAHNAFGSLPLFHEHMPTLRCQFSARLFVCRCGCRSFFAKGYGYYISINFYCFTIKNY